MRVNVAFVLVTIASLVLAAGFGTLEGILSTLEGI